MRLCILLLGILGLLAPMLAKGGRRKVDDWIVRDEDIEEDNEQADKAELDGNAQKLMRELAKMEKMVHKMKGVGKQGSAVPDRGKKEKQRHKHPQQPPPAPQPPPKPPPRHPPTGHSSANLPLDTWGHTGLNYQERHTILVEQQLERNIAHLESKRLRLIRAGDHEAAQRTQAVISSLRNKPLAGPQQGQQRRRPSQQPAFPSPTDSVEVLSRQRVLDFGAHACCVLDESCPHTPFVPLSASPGL